MKHIKRFLRFLGLLILTLAVFIAGVLLIDSHNTGYLQVANQPDSVPTSYIIDQVNIVPMTSDTILPNKSVWVSEGRIKAIAKAGTLHPKGIAVINGHHGYLSPGLIDMHIHLWDRYELGLYLANGVTAVRNLWGYPMHLRIKSDLNNDKILGPVFITSSPKLTSPDDIGDDKVQIATPKEAKQHIIAYKKRGFDIIKTYAGLHPDLFEAIVEQAKESDIKIVSHPSRKMPYLNQFNPQIVSLEHMEEIVQEGLHYKLDSIEIQPIINKFVATKTSFCPTLTGYYKIYEMLTHDDSILKSDKAQYINPLIQQTDSKVQYARWDNEKSHNPTITYDIYKQHQFHLYVLKQMQNNGVNIISGTDAGIGITAPGVSLHEELQFYKVAGFTNYEALKTATCNPSKTQKEFKDMGTVEIGKMANLILTKTNPLDTLDALKTPAWVMVKGHKINPSTLTAFKANAKNRHDFLATALRYAEYLWVEK